MAKGRHRKQPFAPLPPGVQAVTGKSRTASKNQIYKQPLPIHLFNEDTKRPSHASTYTFPAWADYILTLCGYPSSRSKQKQREMDIVQGYWDPMSKSVYLDVTIPASGASRNEAMKDDVDEQSAAMRYLWESGFFGKGTLSRSEPTWHKRQINAIRVKKAREKGGKVFTPEELTALRRKERKAAKIERARLAVKAGQQLPDGIVALGGELTAKEEKAIERAAERELNEEEEEKDESAYGQHIPGLIYLKPTEEERVEANGLVASIQVDEEEYIDVADMERLQLSSYETFFLAGMLGVLEVVDEEGRILSIDHLYSLLMATSLPSTLSQMSPFTSPSHQQLKSLQLLWSRPDNPFLLHYVVYHHYRSLGWVVKDGIKFCCNFLLYKKGPAFSHAEFAVVVIPTYENPDDELSSPFAKHPNGNDRSWVWFSSVNRVNTQVLKTIILCHITIPTLSSIELTCLNQPELFVDALAAGDLYSIREHSIRRFTPQRMRA